MVWRHAAAVVLVGLLLAPIALMVSGSLHDPTLPTPQLPELVPDPATVENYPRAFGLVDLARFGANSIGVAAVAVPLAVLVASWAGFAMTRLPPRARAAAAVATLLALMVPVTALLVPRFAMYRALGLTGTYVPLVAPALLGMSPFYVLIYLRAFRRVPAELFDAARLEGLGPLATWRQVAMPLVRPATMAVAMLAFTASWGSFLEPLIYLYDSRTFTLPLGLRPLAVLPAQEFPLMLAGAAAATAPAVVVFLLVQRFVFKEVRE
jgi:multiple sugar transport system permease protein